MHYPTDSDQKPWLSATGAPGAGPPKRLVPSKIFPGNFRKTIEETIETIAYCIENNGLLSFAPLKFFLAESQNQCF